MFSNTPKPLPPRDRRLWSLAFTAVLGSLTNKRKPRPTYSARLAGEYADAAVAEYRARTMTRNGR